jgi:hypothetical protein
MTKENKKVHRIQGENTVACTVVRSFMKSGLTHPWRIIFFLPTFYFIYLFIFAVLGLELRAFTLSHSTSPIFVKFFSGQGVVNYLPGLASNHNLSDLCLPSSQDYRREPLHPAFLSFLLFVCVCVCVCVWCCRWNPGPHACYLLFWRFISLHTKNMI